MNPAEFANIARAEKRLWWYRGMMRILTTLLPRYTEDRVFRRVLEAGCGTGYLASCLQDRYGFPMYAIDLGHEGVTLARGMGLERVAQADLRKLPFASASFDAVLSMDVLVHLERGEDAAGVCELVRVLAPGGLLVLRVSALDFLRSRHSIFAGEKQRYTRGRLVELARACGLEPLRCTYANSLLLPVAITKFRIWEPLTRQKPASGVGLVHPILDAALYMPLALEARIIGAGLNLPVGQTLILIARKPDAAEGNNRAGTTAGSSADRESCARTADGFRES
jgi:SAM-dependent methyltransferase